jgi:hypothetical protein
MEKHKSQLYILTCLAVLASLLVGCSPAAKLPCPEPGEQIPDPGPGEDYVALTLKNDSCMSVCVLLVSPNHCEYMGGENWVKDHPLRSGESVTKQIPAGKYTVWSELCTEEFIAEDNLKINSDTLHPITDNKPGSSPPCGTSLTIVNNSPTPICNLWIGIGESVYTGWNWVGKEYIQPGDSLSVALRPDTYFIRAESCDAAWLRSEVDVEVSGHQTWIVP